MSLRARLVLALLALAAVGLVVLDLVSYAALRSYLSDRVDQQVESAIGPAIFALGISIEPGAPGQPSQFPRLPNGVEAAPGRRAGETLAAPAARSFPPGPTRSGSTAQNQVVRRQLFSYGESGLPKPELPSELPLSNSADAPRLFTLPASDSSAPDFRAVAVRVPGGWRDDCR